MKERAERRKPLYERTTSKNQEKLRAMKAQYRLYQNYRKNKMKNVKQYFSPKEWELVEDAIHLKKQGFDILKQTAAKTKTKPRMKSILILVSTFLKIF